MAIPIFVAAGAKTAAAQDAIPPLPAGMAAGAIVILVATCPTANTLSITANGSVTTWTAITGSPVTVAAGEALYVWWGRWASGTTGPTVHASASDVVCAGTAAWSGCLDVGSPIDVQATGTETTSDTSFSFATGISSTRNNCLAICVASILRDSNVASVPVMTNTSLAALASRLDYCTTTGAGGGFGLSEGTKATAGTLGTWANTYGAASPKGYITFALIGGKSGIVSPTAITVTDTVVGVRTRLGVVTATALTVTDTVVGVRKRLGVVTATALTVSDVVAGAVVKTGAAALILVVSDVVAGIRKRLGVVNNTALTVTDVVAGFRTRLGVVTLTGVTVSDVVAGFRTRLGVVTPTGLTVADVVAGGRTALGVVTPTALVLVDTVVGSRRTFGVVPLVLTVSDVVAGLRNARGVVSPTTLTLSDIVAGGRSTFGAANTMLTVADVLAGSRSTFGLVSPTTLVVLDTVAGARGTRGVVAPTALLVTELASGVRGAFGSVVVTGLTVADLVAGTRTVFGATLRSEVVTQLVDGFVTEADGSVRAALTLVVTNTVTGRRSTFGVVQLALGVTGVVAGSRGTSGLVLPTDLVVAQSVDGTESLPVVVLVPIARKFLTALLESRSVNLTTERRSAVAVFEEQEDMLVPSDPRLFEVE